MDLSLCKRHIYAGQKVFILKVMTHTQYDENRWKAECGCYEPPPTKSKSQKTK